MNVYNHSRSCMACGNRAEQTGGGVRIVFGSRQWVCAGCKARIDRAKEAA
jgi:transposase